MGAHTEQAALISKIYNQTLTRTYVNLRNERIMLSIAYGGDRAFYDRVNDRVQSPDAARFVGTETMTPAEA